MSDHALAWRTSSYSTNGTCVQVAAAGGVVAVRNSNHPESGTITVGRAPFGSFPDALRAGMMDG
jgi:hypothetical protein